MQQLAVSEQWNLCIPVWEEQLRLPLQEGILRGILPNAEYKLQSFLVLHIIEGNHYKKKVKSHFNLY